MLPSDVRLWDTELSRRRLDHTDEPEPRVVQIAGGDPDMMAEAARRNVDAGAQIIDINMGCPAKKVCNRDAGSALLRDEPLVATILAAVVGAVTVPVTLKIRTGWDRDRAMPCALRASLRTRGIAGAGRSWPHARLSLRGRGRVRNDRRRQAVRARSRVCKRRHRLTERRPRGAARNAARRRDDRTRRTRPAVDLSRDRGAPRGMSGAHRLRATRSRDIMLAHLRDLYAFYGEVAGVRIARKHIEWYCRDRAAGALFRQAVMQVRTRRCTARAGARLFRHAGDATGHAA